MHDPSRFLAGLNPNESDQMQDLLKNKIDQPLRAVVFDRFHAEEAYSHHVYKHQPDALRILDMQDFHALRFAREELVQLWDANNKQLMNETLMDQVMKAYPKLPCPSNTISKSSSVLLRELASIHRCDLTLVCSPEEKMLLHKRYGIPSKKLCVSSYLSESRPDYSMSFDSTRDFVTIGGFKHAPNVDAILWLHREIWPLIRQEVGVRSEFCFMICLCDEFRLTFIVLRQIPDAQMHVYGAYSEKARPIQNLSKQNGQNGFYLHGYARDLDQVFLGSVKPRILLAPIRFGAGIKGKIVDAWAHGVPVVTTPIGAEGCYSTSWCSGENGQYYNWGGEVSSGDAQDFATKAVKLYKDSHAWGVARHYSKCLLEELFDETSNAAKLVTTIDSAMKSMRERRSEDYLGAILWSQNYRSTEYFSRWLEVKNKKTQPP